MYYSFMVRLFNYLKFNWIQITLILFSLYDLRIEVRLLLDYFTFSALFHTIFQHPLAILVLLTIPSMFNKFKKE